MEKVNNSLIQKCLDWGYEQAINGLPGLPTADKLAEDYLKKNNYDANKAATSLIHWQIGKSAGVGFATGLPGLIALPATLPADLASVFYLQIRMVAAIAKMGGLDIKCDQVKTMIFTCLIGDSAVSVIKNAGVEFTKKLAGKQIERLSKETIKRINEAVGFRLVTKYGSKGLINLGKLVPVAGGIIGASFDAVETHIVGKTAKKLFLAE